MRRVDPRNTSSLESFLTRRSARHRVSRDRHVQLGPKRSCIATPVSFSNAHSTETRRISRAEAFAKRERTHGGRASKPIPAQPRIERNNFNLPSSRERERATPCGFSQAALSSAASKCHADQLYLPICSMFVGHSSDRGDIAGTFHVTIYPRGKVKSVITRAGPRSVKRDSSRLHYINQV